MTVSSPIVNAPSVPAAAPGPQAPAHAQPVPSPLQAPEAQPRPVPQGAPVQSQEPTPAPQAQPEPQAPPVDWEANARQAQAQLTAVQQQIAQAARQAQMQQAEQQEASAAEQRRQMTYAQAQMMDPAQGFQFIQQYENSERVRQQQRAAMTMQQRDAEYRAMVARVAAPQYAEELAGQHKLPADLAAELRQMPGELMDAMAPRLAAIARARETSMNQLQQQNLSQQAAAMQATGAYTTGGLNPAPGIANSQQDRPKNRIARDVADYRRVTGRG